MSSLKAWATRSLRESALISPELRIWTRHGSTRWISTQVSLDTAIDYVIRFQDPPR